MQREVDIVEHHQVDIAVLVVGLPAAADPHQLLGNGGSGTDRRVMHSIHAGILRS